MRPPTLRVRRGSFGLGLRVRGRLGGERRACERQEQSNRNRQQATCLPQPGPCFFSCRPRPARRDGKFKEDLHVSFNRRQSG